MAATAAASAAFLSCLPTHGIAAIAAASVTDAIELVNSSFNFIGLIYFARSVILNSSL